MLVAVVAVVALVAEVAVEALPLNVAVIVPALKLPDASRETIVETVFALVAFEVTVNVLEPDWSAVKVAEPDKPVPDTPIVSVPLFGLGTDDHAPSPRKKLDALGVPEPKRAGATVPDEMFEPFNVVKFAPETAPKLPDHVPAVTVPTEVKLELTTVALSVVPVKVAAFAVTVPEPPKLIAVPLIVVLELAKALLGTETKRAFGSVPLVILEAFVVSVVADGARPVISDAAGCPHSGAAEAEPLPVCCKNFLVVVVLPANLETVFVADE
jgi:hypothetical protein